VAESATAAQLIVKCLESEGVSVVFGIPGKENIHFVQALAGPTKIRYILTRHEQGASFMAEMYGRVTGHAAVVSVTLGPGAINMLLGVADATTNSTPMVAISARVVAHQLDASSDWRQPRDERNLAEGASGKIRMTLSTRLVLGAGFVASAESAVVAQEK
jgi:thiamine pyrophosphate-dependent acetolactate synthase large subunit-like protein